MEQKELFLTEAKIKEAINREESFGNQILYKMCKEAPDHKDPKVVEGKIWLIGRSYSASLERQKGSIESSILYKNVATSLRKLELDSRIDKLKTFTTIEQNDTETIEYILYTHWIFVMAAKQEIHIQKTSLASKYLHFHVPRVFFIYDRYAREKLQELEKEVPMLSRTSQYIPKNYSKEYDYKYTVLFFKALKLRDHIRDKYGYELSPRMIDTLLLFVK